MRRIPILVGLLGMLVAPATVRAQGSTAKTPQISEVAAPSEKKPFYRGSAFVYSNSLSAVSLSKAAEPQFNPYYSQRFSFQPRFYPTDDLSFRARFDVEIELTKSDTTDYARQWVISDLLFDAVYEPKWMKIPLLDIKVTPSIRLSAPTSLVSQGRSLILGFTPGVNLKRGFDLRKGTWLKKIELMYGLRVAKNFHRYAQASVDSDRFGCVGVDRPECQHSGLRNVNWRFTNMFSALLHVHPKLSFTASFSVMNDLLYGLPEQTVPTNGGVVVTLPASEVNHKAALWAVFDVSYEVMSWLSLSLGASTYHPQLAPDSSYYTPFFNRHTTFYFDMTIPIDGFVDQVKAWSGKGRQGT
ncbi:MAG: hypothetical protein IT371_03345 [Deltaproteobacteria bacterium]|nr:hypothetical protein [Deltaproteobacteria bacterium]